MVGVGEEEGGRGPAAVSQADMNAALEEFAAAASNKPADENHLLNVNLLGMLMAVSAAAVPAEDLGTTIKQAATAVFAHFSESPTNWCASPPFCCLTLSSWLLMVPLPFNTSVMCTTHS